jgi:hypothetical protein
MITEGIACGGWSILNAVWLSYDCGMNTFHIYANAYPTIEMLKIAELIVCMCTGQCYQTLSIVVQIIFDEVQLSNER